MIATEIVYEDEHLRLWRKAGRKRLQPDRDRLLLLEPLDDDGRIPLGYVALAHIVHHLAMIEEGQRFSPTFEGAERLRRFLDDVIRFGPTDALQRKHGLR
jgi:hypothetical protein